MNGFDQTFVDRFIIRERIEAYIDALNHRDWVKFEDFWTEDMVWSTSDPINSYVSGRSEMVLRMKNKQETNFDYIFQMGHAIVVHDLTEKTARARHTLHIISDKFTAIGVYYDMLVKEADGKWRFKRRDYRITYYDESPLPGKAFRRLPDPAYGQLPQYP